MALPDALETGNHAVLLILTIGVILCTDFVGIEVSYWKFGAWKVFFPLELEFLLELGIHCFISRVIGIQRFCGKIACKYERITT
jgi:hypothetical protein